MYELKIYKEVICHGNEEWFKIERGIDLPFQNSHDEFDKFWWALFESKYIIFELKKYRGVIFDDSEHWCRIWRKLICAF